VPHDNKLTALTSNPDTWSHRPSPCLWCEGRCVFYPALCYWWSYSERSTQSPLPVSQSSLSRCPSDQFWNTREKYL